MFPAFVLTALAVAAPPADAEARRRAEDLVSHLGDPSYREREKAARELLEMGYPARDAVLAGQKSADTEVSDRCKKLYPAIWRHQLEKRVRLFVDAPDGPVPDDLPGATRWLKLVGDGKDSRALYAELVTAHPEPLFEVELHPERLRETYLELARSVYGRITPRPIGATIATRYGPAESEVLLYLFLGAAGDVRPATLAGISPYYHYQFLNAPALTERLSSTEPSAVPVRKLFAAWLEKERYSTILRRAIDTAAQNKVRECAPAVLKIAADPTVIMTVRSAALLGFGKLGTTDDLPALEPFLKDKTQISIVPVNGERWPVQVRDVALGAAVQLAGQNLSDYGFERKPPNTITTISSYIYYAFESDEKRDAAQQKWREWRSGQR